MQLVCKHRNRQLINKMAKNKLKKKCENITMAGLNENFFRCLLVSYKSFERVIAYVFFSSCLLTQPQNRRNFLCRALMNRKVS